MTVVRLLRGDRARDCLAKHRRIEFQGGRSSRDARTLQGVDS